MEELKSLNDTFNCIDLDHEGFISIEELENAFLVAKIKISKDELDKVLEQIDNDKNGKLNYSEFLLASLNIKEFLNHNRVRKIFQSYDTENSGFIDLYSVKLALLRSGREVEDLDEFSTMMKEVTNGKLRISYDDFYSLFTS